MKKIFVLIFLAIYSSLLTAQLVVTREGEVVNNTVSGTWEGINISRAVRTNLSFLNNSITSVNASGYLLQAGDELPLSTNTNLNGAVITGNKLTWNGSDDASITHGMFLGYNINYTVKYNYLDKTPYGILFKSGTDAGVNMTYSSGYGAAYNIVKNSKLSLRMKGINGVQVYNNTFYSNQGSGSVVLIDANHDRTDPAPSTGAKIKNNIFYTVYQIHNIAIESDCLSNFESDYNVFYCEEGTPVFSVGGATKTFSQWQAMGYDQHSVVVNPGFINTTDFVPKSRLNYGTNLGSTWQTGLSTTARWVADSSPAKANQNGTWQAGAVIYAETSPPVVPSPVFVSASVENATPGVLEMIYSLTLAATVPAASAFAVRVNSTARNINSVAVSGTKVILTLASPVVYGDVVTVAYTKPATNPLQTASGGQAATISAQSVLNKVSQVIANPAFVSAAIGNDTPARIDIVYSLSLASIIPAVTAYAVKVSSVARAVSKITVSGNVVLLTLASPVVSGDVVTVAYTKPASNPLQTSSGGQAATINAQPVTNKVVPVNPAYVSSAIENNTPSLLEMVYNLSLSSSVPASSAFAVKVNSVARNINTVAVSGTKVSLTLASPVVYGDVVTVAYTKPAASPLQTASGGQAASITAQTVINRVARVVSPPVVVNTPPVVVINAPPNNLSGFVGVLDASGSYDINKDNLTYTWVVPANISVSSTNSSKINFLGPVVNTAQTVEFKLNISDGKTVQSKAVIVEILPYKPELEAAEVSNIEASTFQSPYHPVNIIDGNIGTMWSANGDAQWVVLELKELFSIQHVKVAFQPGQKSQSYFDILGSEDGITWEPIIIKASSCAFSGDLQVFDFPSSKSAIEFKHVKLVGHANSVDSWNHISEFKIFGYKHRNPTSYDEQPVKLYPNPANEIVNVRIDDTSLEPGFVKIVSLSGRVMYDNKIIPGTLDFQIPLDLKKGIYIVQFGTGNLTLFTQKLVIGDHAIISR